MIRSKIELNGVVLPTSIYSDGSVDVTILNTALNGNSNPNYSLLTADLVDSAGIIGLLQVLEYFKEKGLKVDLALSYLPNARQERTQELEDRVKPNTFKAFARCLSLYKEEILNLLVVDPHSTVNVEILSELGFKVRVHELADLCPPVTNMDYIIAPDEGATYRAKLLADKYNVPLLIANKERDPITKEIKLSFNTHIDLEGDHVLVVDDLIDYGTSIHELTKSLKQDYKVRHISVFVTHAILPENLRINPPSRTSFALQYVNLFYCHNLFDLEGSLDHELNETRLI